MGEWPLTVRRKPPRREFSTPTLHSSRLKTPRGAPTLLALTALPTSALRNSRLSTPVQREAAPSVLRTPIWVNWKCVPISRTLLIGPPMRQLLTQSRTRDNVAAVGLSPLWALWKALTQFHQASWEVMQNSKWSIAPPTVAPRVAAAASTSTALLTLERLELLPRAATRTRPPMELAGQALSPRNCQPAPLQGTTQSEQPTKLSCLL